jgi:hypothetical protein
MRKLITKRFGSLMISLLVFSSVSFSQFDNVDFLRSAPSDGVKFVQAYISPWANAFGAGLNGGWYNTAKPHKFGGFDITAGINLGMVPSSDEKFEINTLGLSSSLAGTGPAPSIAGSTSNGPQMTYKDVATDVTLATFNTPPGTNWKLMPVPTAQVGIGLPKGTELKFRFLPKLNIKSGDISLWGVGLLHSIMQYIPGNKLLPLDVSIFAGYTKLTANVPLSLQPGVPNTISASIPLNNQNLETTIDALNISAIASLSIPVLTIYGGIGYSKTKTLVELSGNFPTPVLVTPAAALPYAEYNDSGIKKGSDFPKMEIENFSGLRANIGLRVKLAVVTINVDYTRAQYNVISAGLGISFR